MVNDDNNVGNDAAENEKGDDDDGGDGDESDIDYDHTDHNSDGGRGICVETDHDAFVFSYICAQAKREKEALQARLKTAEDKVIEESLQIFLTPSSMLFEGPEWKHQLVLYHFVHEFCCCLRNDRSFLSCLFAVFGAVYQHSACFNN